MDLSSFAHFACQQRTMIALWYAMTRPAQLRLRAMLEAALLVLCLLWFDLAAVDGIRMKLLDCRFVTDYV